MYANGSALFRLIHCPFKDWVKKSWPVSILYKNGSMAIGEQTVRQRTKTSFAKRQFSPRSENEIFSESRAKASLSGSEQTALSQKKHQTSSVK